MKFPGAGCDYHNKNGLCLVSGTFPLHLPAYQNDFGLIQFSLYFTHGISFSGVLGTKTKARLSKYRVIAYKQNQTKEAEQTLTIKRLRTEKSKACLELYF